MSASRPLRCLFAKSSTSFPCIRQSFHTSRPRHARQPRYPSIKASELGLLEKQNSSTGTDRKPSNELNKKRSKERRLVKSFEPYSEEDWKKLAQIYTPEQLKAIEVGEAAVPTDDLLKQGALREDSFALPYMDDLSYIHPVVDKPIRAPKSNYDPNWRFKETNELLDDVVDWVKNLPDEPDRLDWLKFRDNVRLTVGKEEAERNPRSYLAPELPKIDSLPRTSEKDEIEPAMRRLMLQTGYTLDEIKRFRVKVLVMHRVVNQTRMGKVSSLYLLAVAGNGRGLLGIGEGKAAEIEHAKRQASMSAVRNMVPIPRYEDRTIYGDVKGKVGATEVEMMTRPPGKTKHTSSFDK
jgi:small subunit ribosomal protein S5